MERNNVLPNAERTASEMAIWIHEDGQSLPYKHIVDGVCECPTCDRKIRHIILPCAA
jgi:hypothetical protein